MSSKSNFGSSGRGSEINLYPSMPTAEKQFIITYEYMNRIAFRILMLVFLMVSIVGCKYTVTKTDDTNDGSCSNADCSLREAIIAANTWPGADTIVLPRGTYELNREGDEEDLSDTGDLDILDGVTIEGAGQDITIIDGISSDRVLDVRSGILYLKNVTIRGGRTANGGAGIRVLAAGQIDARKVEISGNVEYGPDSPAVSNSQPSRGMGAGLYSEGHSTLIDVVFSENQNIKRYEPGFAHGAGMYVSGPRKNINDYEGTITKVLLEDVRFYNNRCVGNGGGIYLASYLDATLNSLDMEHNGSYYGDGGGIYSYPYHEPEKSSLVINDSRIYDGWVKWDGGGISIKGNAQVYRSSISNNEAEGSGGGVYAGNGDVLLRDCTINGNIAGGSGGGVYCYNGTTIENSTISGNEADFGGGVHINLYEQNFLRNCTIVDNKANINGGGLNVSFAGEVKVVNTIIANNTKPSDPPILTKLNLPIFNLNNCHIAWLDEGDIPELSLGNNLSNDQTCAFIKQSDIIADPVLGLLANNGGPTLTHALLSGSPAIDQGTNFTCPTRDQRGFPRSAIGELCVYICDMGAYEWQP